VILFLFQPFNKRRTFCPERCGITPSKYRSNRPCCAALHVPTGHIFVVFSFQKAAPIGFVIVKPRIRQSYRHSPRSHFAHFLNIHCDRKGGLRISTYPFARIWHAVTVMQIEIKNKNFLIFPSFEFFQRNGHVVEITKTPRTTGWRWCPGDDYAKNLCQSYLAALMAAGSQRGNVVDPSRSTDFTCSGLCTLEYLLLLPLLLNKSYFTAQGHSQPIRPAGRG